MGIRPYIPSKDYECVSKWIDNERAHTFWYANRLPYPITQYFFHDFLEKNAIDRTDRAYVATENSGQLIGFFCYSINTEDNIGFLKFVIADKTKREKGYGNEMLNPAIVFPKNSTLMETAKILCLHSFGLMKMTGLLQAARLISTEKITRNIVLNG